MHIKLYVLFLFIEEEERTNLRFWKLSQRPNFNGPQKSGKKWISKTEGKKKENARSTNEMCIYMYSLKAPALQLNK